ACGGDLLDAALLAAVRSSRAARPAAPASHLAELPLALARLLQRAGQNDDALAATLAVVGEQVGARRLLLFDNADAGGRFVGWRATAGDRARLAEMHDW